MKHFFKYINIFVMNKTNFLSLIIFLILFILFSCTNNLEHDFPGNNKYLSYIQISPPTKTKYLVGDSFDSTGLIVKAFYTDSSSKDVTEQASITGFDSSNKAIAQTITVSYTEDNITKSCTFTISIRQTYTVRFHSNDDNANQTSQIIQLNEGETLNANSFVYNNYYFLKWNTKADGTGCSYKDLALTSELVISSETDSIDLYAIWVSNNPIVITSSNYQTILQSLQNVTNREYLLYCTDELTQEIFNEIKSTLYNLYETKISLDFSSITTKVSIDFSDKDYDSLVSISMPKIKDRQNYGFRFNDYSSYKCKNLKKVQLDNKTTSIGFHAFYNCTSLESINIPDTLSEIDQSAFSKTKIAEVIVPNSVTRIGNKAFADCPNLKKVVLGNGISYIGEDVFWWCKSLETINIPDNVTKIGYRAFTYCEKLKTITIPDSVTKIDSNAFENCTSLETVSMGKNVNLIETCAFKSCTNLVTVTLSEGLSQISDSCFSGCSKLKNISLPNRLTSLGSSAFFECTSLEEIIIPNKITSIGWYTFKNCTNLRRITFKSGILEIAPHAFIGCSNLSEAIFEITANWNLEDMASPPHSANIPSTDFSNTSLIATYLRDTYSKYGWSKNED